MLGRMRVIYKIGLSIGIISTILGLCVWYSTARLNEISGSYSGFIAREAKGAANARRANRFVFEMNHALYRAIMEPDAETKALYLAQMDKAYPQLKQLMDRLSVEAPTFASRLQPIAVRIDRLIEDSLKVRALLEKGQPAQALDLMHNAVDPNFKEIYMACGTLSSDIAAYMDTEAAALRAQAETTRTTVLAFSGIGVVLSLICAALIAMFGISRPLGSLVTVLQRMAAGETDISIPEGKRGDEIGAVGRAVENIRSMVAKKAAEQAELARITDAAAASERRRAMIELADGFQEAVGGIVGMVSSSATELQATASTMTATARETASQSIAVAAAAEEAATNVGTVAAAAEELGSSVQEIGRQVASSADLAQMAVGEADQTARLVTELSQAANRIGDVVSLISTIAGQTNLLALNATIEAARAGEAGRGFAVVATEVKELASQTARATEEISGQIARIQGATGDAVQAISGISTRIREINTVAATIAAAVEEQGAATQEIVRNVAQAATGTSEVTGNISGVAGAAEETGAAATQVLASASELSRQSEHLNAEVGRFLATVRAA
ncbi:methyl-accepting chemotaxis protein [Methylobacterium sp. J-078]|uniref:methyl-accepting chemotaxis protein n=1 Tax=Methylobacterium sp. J-078 TaxID=2836657 RepID=UPI001FBA7D8D|nr:HAMP domain-containing methyl-accepting chemotaxis protein [Methylobacterium sp. J-078]MCJ2045725.1 methyl-accepting chemotaxis protein [Methylobacterium sp. J-078]